MTPGAAGAEVARAWLDTGLRAAATGPVAEPSAVAPWLLAAYGAHPWAPPPGAVVDWGRLLLGPRVAPMASSHPVALPTALLPAVARYRDHLLGRLGVDPLLGAVRDAAARHGVVPQPQVVSAWVGLVVERLRERQPLSLPSPDFPTLRRQLRHPQPVARGLAQPGAEGVAVELLQESYGQLAAAARRFTRLLTPEMVAVLEALPVLERPSQRLALGQLLRAKGALAAGLASPRPQARGERAPAGAARGNQPTGGFWELATGGRVAQLVASELALVEDDGAVDAFDARWAADELLCYRRDEGAKPREERLLVIALPTAIDTLGVKDPELPHRRSVLLLAALMALGDRWLGDGSHRATVAWLEVGPPNVGPWEWALLEVVGRGAFNAGLAQRLRVADPEALGDWLAEHFPPGTGAGQGRQVELIEVHLTPQPRLGQVLQAKGITLGHHPWRCDGPVPLLLDASAVQGP
ncbi:MAG: hypothetical protein ACFCBW_10305, partial [Candidatus Competibacterales bacterium]